MTQEPNFEADATRLLSCIDQIHDKKARKVEVMIALEKQYNKGKKDSAIATFCLPSGGNVKIREAAQ